MSFRILNHIENFFGMFKNAYRSDSSADSIQTAWKDFCPEDMTLFLVDMYTWTTVGDGYKIDEADEVDEMMASKFLPLMAGTVKAMKCVNGVGKLGRMFGLRLPEIPQSMIEKANTAVDELEIGSQNEFQCVVDAAQHGGGEHEMSRFQQVGCATEPMQLGDGYVLSCVGRRLSSNASYRSVTQHLRGKAC